MWRNDVYKTFESWWQEKKKNNKNICKNGEEMMCRKGAEVYTREAEICCNSAEVKVKISAKK